MYRGDIVYIRNDDNKSVGHETMKDRPAIIVSNNLCNEHSPVIEVVFTTTSPRKRLLPTHVIIHSTPLNSIALCEAVYSVDKSRVDSVIGHCSTSEILRINHALSISLGLI